MTPRLPALLLLVPLLLSEAADARAQQRKVVLVDRIVAQVDDEVVTWLDVRARLAPYEKQLTPGDRDYARKREELVRGVLMKRIDELLVAKAAKAMSLTAEPAEIDSALRLITTEHHLTPADLDAALKLQGLTLPAYRAEIARQLLEAKWIRARIGADTAPANATEEQRREWLERRTATELQKLRDEAYVDIRL